MADDRNCYLEVYRWKPFCCFWKCLEVSKIAQIPKPWEEPYWESPQLEKETLVDGFLCCKLVADVHKIAFVCLPQWRKDCKAVAFWMGGSNQGEVLPLPMCKQLKKNSKNLVKRNSLVQKQQPTLCYLSTQDLHPWEEEYLNSVLSICISYPPKIYIHEEECLNSVLPICISYPPKIHIHERRNVWTLCYLFALVIHQRSTSMRGGISTLCATYLH